MSADYHVVPSPLASPARITRARRYDNIESAVAVMGTGIVLADKTRLAAFHESHLPLIERLTHTRGA